METKYLGGQAVIEGVLMRYREQYAIAVRKPDRELVVEKFKNKKKAKMLQQIPILRGIIAFVEALIIGMKALTFSARFFEEEEKTKFGKQKKISGEQMEKLLFGFTICLAILLSGFFFILLPYFFAFFLAKVIPSFFILSILEGGFRILLFLLYVIFVSKLQDMKRIFMYHGAEHKVIHCVEQEEELTIANVKKQKKEHKRCGTNFLFLVMLLSIFGFALIRTDYVIGRILLRVLLIPLIAGISYELIRMAGETESNIVSILSYPGLWLQKFTTKEPEDAMIEVAICALEEVYDWKAKKEEKQKRLQQYRNRIQNVRNSSRKEKEEQIGLHKLDHYLGEKKKEETKKGCKKKSHCKKRTKKGKKN